ncbi:MAG: alpha-isopropylmalate synthase regulatory domain-containing protein, partial [Pseudomonadota bacterium]
GIHAHNDTENAVANSLAALQAGARQLQGTINGLGERCGNANLISLLPTLALKMGYDVGKAGKNLDKLTSLSLMLDERLNRQPVHQQPYVGKAAFAHKGGLHASGVNRDPATYEHIDPALVGNRRYIVMSNQAGRANVLAQMQAMEIVCDDKNLQEKLLKAVKEKERRGYSYDGAQASFELLIRRAIEDWQGPFTIKRFRVIDERRHNSHGKLVNESEATVYVSIDGQECLAAGQGNGPVNALDVALRNLLAQKFPALRKVRLIDYKVRILPPGADSSGTEAVTQVTIESRADDGTTWRTVGVSENIIEASALALTDAYEFCLLHG